MQFHYDMVVIGGGAAGLSAASMAALLGAKTALIEADRLGGECTWTGCIPSKTLLHAARITHQTRHSDRFGLTPTDPPLDFARLMDHVRRTRQQIYEEADAPPHLEKLGVEVIPARARFLNPHTIELQPDRRQITSRKFILATGSLPKLAHFAHTPLTNETLFELQTQPRDLLILGAGPVGIEMAQAFARLGSSVTVVAPGERILSHDDPDHAQRLQTCLVSENVSFLLGRKVTQLDGTVATLDDGRTVPYDSVLAALGREPDVAALQLDQANVRCSSHGVEVDHHCRTSERHIFAAGDVTSRFPFTHMAEHMSKVAVLNALLHWPAALDDKHVVWSTFTDPELAHLGASVSQLREAQAKFETFRFPYTKLDRALTAAQPEGEIKVFANPRGRILGVSILGHNAGEMISEWALAMRHGISLSEISDTIHPYPTYSLGNRRAADLFVAKQLDSPLLALFGRLMRYRGRRAGSRALG